MGARSELGQTIALTRRRKGMSQGALGSLCGVSAQQVSRWERATAIPARTALARLADALGLDWRSLNDLAIDAGAEEIADRKRELADARAELEATLAEVKRFVDQYQDFHAAYQKIGPQITDVLTGMVNMQAEIAEIKQALVAQRRRPKAP